MTEPPIVRTRALEHADRDAAARLLADAHAAAWSAEPHLPDTPADVGGARGLLDGVLAWPGAKGCVAVDGARVVGFMIAAPARPVPGVPPSIFVPAAGHAGSLEAYPALVGWLADRARDCFVEVAATDTDTRQVFAGAGFAEWLTLASRALPVPTAVAPDVEVRQATTGDVSALITLAAALRDHHGDPPSPTNGGRARQEALLADPRTGVWVAVADGEVVGMLVLQPPGSSVSALHLPAATIHLPDAIVRPAARGRGIGGALMAEALGWAHAIGYRHCTVHVRSGNRAAARFWAARGFRAVAHRLLRPADRSDGPAAS